MIQTLKLRQMVEGWYRIETFLEKWKCKKVRQKWWCISTKLHWMLLPFLLPLPPQPSKTARPTPLLPPTLQPTQHEDKDGDFCDELFLLNEQQIIIDAIVNKFICCVCVWVSSCENNCTARTVWDILCHHHHLSIHHVEHCATTLVQK